MMVQPGAGRRQFEPYQAFILAAMLLAVFGGFLLAVLIPLGRALDWGWEQRKPEILQVHGQVQVLGFAGLYVIGMSLRLSPRFARLRLRFEGLTLPVWAAIVVSLLVRLLVLPWLAGTVRDVVLVSCEAAMLAAALGFFLMIGGSFLGQAHAGGATAHFFLVGAFFFLLQAVVHAAAALDRLGDRGVLSYLPDTAVIYLQLAGFILAFVAGVSGRAIPPMVGRVRSERGATVVAALQGLAVLVLAGALLWLEYGSYSRGMVRVADAALVVLGPVFLAIVWLAAVLRPLETRLRPASKPHLWLVRSAFAWLAVAGAIAMYLGGKGLVDGALPTQMENDALRHTLSVGMVTMLIVGMSLLIVPEFAGQRMASPQQGWLSFGLLGLLNAAVVLRVAPALAGSHWSGATRDWSMATSGVAAELAMVLFVLSFVDLLAAGIPIPILPSETIREQT